MALGGSIGKRQVRVVEGLEWPGGGWEERQSQGPYFIPAT